MRILCSLKVRQVASVARIIEVPKDPSRSHPFRQKEVVDQVKAAIAGIQINPYDIQCVNKTYGVKQRSEYFYQGRVKGSPAQYSQTLVDWLVQQCRKDAEFFQKARRAAKERA